MKNIPKALFIPFYSINHTVFHKNECDSTLSITTLINFNKYE